MASLLEVSLDDLNAAFAYEKAFHIFVDCMLARMATPLSPWEALQHLPAHHAMFMRKLPPYAFVSHNTRRSLGNCVEFNAFALAHLGVANTSPLMGNTLDEHLVDLLDAHLKVLVRSWVLERDILEHLRFGCMSLLKVRELVHLRGLLEASWCEEAIVQMDIGHEHLANVWITLHRHF